MLDAATAQLAAERDLSNRALVLREAEALAKKANDVGKLKELRQQLDAIERERAETLVRDFIMPIATNLARKIGGENAKPTIDETYQMNKNPRLLATETWRRLHLPGYGPAPKTAAQVAAEAAADEKRLVARANELGFTGDDQAGFVSYTRKARAEWLRASELESPAPRGHFLRILGQSDRDMVDNGNGSASIPQALLLMNSELTSKKALLSPYSPLMRFINAAGSPGEKVDAAYFALLSRKATAHEKALWEQVSMNGKADIEDLVYALLNTKQFIFIQ